MYGARWDGFVNEELLSLISRVRGGDEGAFSDLTLQYRPLIESMARRFLKKSDGDMLLMDDVMQEAALAFYSAACSYDVNSEVTFGLYAKICIRNRLVSMQRALYAKKKKRKPREKTVSQDPVNRLLDKENSELLEKKIDSALSKLEMSVFELYVQKKTYVEIAGELGISVKSVDNAIYRIKTKLRRLI